MDVHDTSWTLNAAYVWGLPPGMAPAFAILASNDAAAKVASKNSAAAGVQLFQPLGYCHTAIYTRIYIQDPCLDRFYAQSQGKLSFLKAGVYLESKSKKWRVGEIFEYAVCAARQYIAQLYQCVYILLYFWKPFHQLRFCPPRMFSSTSALLGLSRSADYSASNANLLLGFAWDRLLEGKIGKKSVEFWCGLNSTPRNWKFQMMKHWSS